MKKILAFALFLFPMLSSAQLLVPCAGYSAGAPQSGTPCSPTGPAGSGTGSPNWYSFGALNSDISSIWGTLYGVEPPNTFFAAAPSGTTNTPPNFRQLTIGDFPATPPVEVSNLTYTVSNGQNGIVFQNFSGSAVQFFLPEISSNPQIVGSALPSAFQVVINNSGSGEIAVTAPALPGGTQSSINGSNSPFQIFPGSSALFNADSGSNYVATTLGVPSVAALFLGGSTTTSVSIGGASTTTTTVNSTNTVFTGGINDSAGVTQAARFVATNNALPAAGNSAGFNSPATTSFGCNVTGNSCYGIFTSTGNPTSVASLQGVIDGSGNLIWNALGAGQDVLFNWNGVGTSASNGFPWLPCSAGTPAGAITRTGIYANSNPIEIDCTNSKLFMYSGGAWRNVANQATSLNSSILTQTALSGSNWALNGIGLSIPQVTYTDTYNGGTIASESAYTIAAPTFVFSNPTTLTNLASLYVGAPVCSTNCNGSPALYSFLTGGLLGSFGGLTSVGGVANINAGTSASANFNTNINTGTSTGITSIGNSSSTLNLNAGTVAGTTLPTYLASPPAIGGTAPAAATFTTLTLQGGIVATNSGSPPVVTPGGTGGCTINTVSGGPKGVSFTINSIGTGVCTFSVALPTVTHGWTCRATDVTPTTPIGFVQTGWSTNSCKVTSGTAVAVNDQLTITIDFGD